MDCRYSTQVQICEVAKKRFGGQIQLASQVPDCCKTNQVVAKHFHLGLVVMPLEISGCIVASCWPTVPYKRSFNSWNGWIVSFAILRLLQESRAGQICYNCHHNHNHHHGTRSTIELTFCWLLTSLSNLNNATCAYSVRLLVRLLARILQKKARPRLNSVSLWPKPAKIWSSFSSWCIHPRNLRCLSFRMIYMLPM